VICVYESVLDDTISNSGSDGDTYLKMIRHNTAAIVGNLSGA
jgi:ABC-type Zn uptake system ZnuABC Zn-binding protein ZnuA